MASNAQKGARYKARTKRWLEAQGYTVVDLEIVRWIHKPDGTRIPVKRDQMACDLLAVKAATELWIQVKGGEQARGNGQFLPAQREFANFTFPHWSEQWVVAWAPRARQPRIIRVEKRDHDASRQDSTLEYPNPVPF